MSLIEKLCAITLTGLLLFSGYWLFSKIPSPPPRPGCGAGEVEVLVREHKSHKRICIVGRLP